MTSQADINIYLSTYAIICKELSTVESLNAHLAKTDTKSWSMLFFTPFSYWTDISLRRTHSADPKGIHVKLEGVNYMLLQSDGHKFS